MGSLFWQQEKLYSSNLSEAKEKDLEKEGTSISLPNTEQYVELDCSTGLTSRMEDLFS